MFSLLLDNVIFIIGLVAFFYGINGYICNREYAYSIRVLKPSSSLSDEFEEFAKAAFAQRRCLIEQNAKLGRARDLLLPRLMDGRLSV
jgi:type I restriction enzyme S subunit